ncbi:nitrogen regulation protein NR(II) [Thermodesulfobacteriota bacterium]
MVDFGLKIPQTELQGRLQKLMLLRLLFISLLLGASIFIQIKETRTYFGDIQTSHYLLIGTVYFLTFIYLLLFKTLKDLFKQAYFQLLVDTFFVTAIIYSTGGIDSIFSFLYILTIINGSIILYRKGGMVIASSSSILYGLLLDLHYYDIIHPFSGGLSYSSEDQSLNIAYMIVVNIAAFYLVAFLSSYPSEQARKSRFELKAKEDDIIKLEALNELIIRSITSGLITLDGQGRIILFNPAAEDIFGIDTGQVIGKRVTDILPFLTDYFEKDAEIQPRDTKNPPSFIDLQYPGQNDKNLSLRFFISPLRIPDGNQKGQILFFQDITEMRQIEEEMKKVEGLALIGELAAGIAHEIRNPMASISGSIQMLKEGMKRDPVNSRLMDIILREINRLNHLVNDFLLFARPKPANFREFDLKPLIIESLELFKNSGKWNDKMKMETDFHGKISLFSDPEQVKQVLWNIFLNAVDAMPDGGLLHVSTDTRDSIESTESGRKMVKVTVRDTGEGFSERALSYLFTPFFTTKEGGSGLGLATVKRIVEGLKGKVYGENHPDGGAEITVLFERQPKSPDSGYAEVG